MKYVLTAAALAAFLCLPGPARAQAPEFPFSAQRPANVIPVWCYPAGQVLGVLDGDGLAPAFSGLTPGGVRIVLFAGPGGGWLLALALPERPDLLCHAIAGGAAEFIEPEPERLP